MLSLSLSLSASRTERIDRIYILFLPSGVVFNIESNCVNERIESNEEEWYEFNPLTSAGVRMYEDFIYPRTRPWPGDSATRNYWPRHFLFNFLSFSVSMQSIVEIVLEILYFHLSRGWIESERHVLSIVNATSVRLDVEDFPYFEIFISNYIGDVFNEWSDEGVGQLWPCHSCRIFN